MWQKFRNWVAKVLNLTVETSPPMEEESFLEWLGIRKKHKGSVTSEVTYFTCLKMMSETVAKLPWKYYQKTDQGIEEPELSDIRTASSFRSPVYSSVAFAVKPFLYRLFRNSCDASAPSTVCFRIV